MEATPCELVSARQAALVLIDAGLSRSQARRLLATGVAGQPLRTPAADLFDAERVRVLRTWPSVDETALPSPADRALLEVRGTAAAGCATTGFFDLAHLNWVVRIQLGEAVSRYGFVPVVVTSSSFVVATWEATTFHPAEGGRGRVTVRPAGSWAEAFRQRRLYSPPGNQWLLWTPEIMGVG